jgi:hypothetical protein
MISLAIAISVLGLFFLIVFIIKIFINQRYLSEIVAIVKTDSYINEDTNLNEDIQKSEQGSDVI